MRRLAAILGTITALAMGAVMNPSFAQAAAQPMHAGEPGYDIVLEAAAQPLREAVGSTVDLSVERMDRLGPWAFVIGSMRAPGGGRPDFAGTRFADAAQQGAMSDVYVALLRREDDGADATAAPGASPAAPADAAARDQAGLSQDVHEGAGQTPFPDGGRWVVLDFAIGPGDVAWLSWPQEHAAPRALFGF